MESILDEIDRQGDQTSELIHLQDKLSASESELIALQIRFMHK